LIAKQPIVLALEAECHAARSTVEAIFTFVAEFFVALGRLCSIHALVAF
jgi:hypothetical protein